MNTKNILTAALSFSLALNAAGCSAKTVNTEDTNSSGAITIGNTDSGISKIDNSKWNYNKDDNVYYQIGLSYCSNPADAGYEKLAIFVPGDYLTAKDNGDGTYTCEINEAAEINGYKATTAPIVFPVNTPGYSAQNALTSYTDVSSYTNAGFVYAHAGCRGRDAGAPAGVTDLKAAIRYIRYSDEGIAGDAESIFAFGMSGGGAQTAVLGSTGDSELYDVYLEQIGAVNGVSDSVLGAMCWCPITNLDTADEAYEWMMGTTRNGLSSEEQAISDKLAEAFATYINNAGIKDEQGNVLTLSASSGGIYQSGSYYEYIKNVIEESLNTFLANTTFPYNASSNKGMGGIGHGGEGRMRDGNSPDGKKPERDNGDFTGRDNITRNAPSASSSGLDLTGTYQNAKEYINALNANENWVTYDAETNTARITSVASFVKALKNASKNLGAFDQLDAGQGENTLFGYGSGSGAHFDATLASILSDLGSAYADSYKSDLVRSDSVGNAADTRLAMYTPLYYLLESEKGYKTSTVSKYWRIRTGINQGDCALSTEVNLALALQNYDQVKSVDFATVWGQGHTQAEVTGTSTENFISWINECMKG